MSMYIVRSLLNNGQVITDIVWAASLTTAWEVAVKNYNHHHDGTVHLHTFPAVCLSIRHAETDELCFDVSGDLASYLMAKHLPPIVPGATDATE